MRGIYKALRLKQDRSAGCYRSKDNPSMGKISEMNKKIRLPLTIKIHPYLYDHKFAGRAVLPAALAIQILAESTCSAVPGMDDFRIFDASFPRFLYLPFNAAEIQAFNEIVLWNDGSVSSSLLTITASNTQSIKRAKEHVLLKFGTEANPLEEIPIDIASALKGNCFKVSASKLYKELVPFGISFQNTQGNIYLSKDGAVGYLRAPDFAPDGALGSPFPLDAAFHVACAWGQRFAGIVGFPVGFDSLVIKNKIESGKKYFCRIIPSGMKDAVLIFDLWIYDIEGMLFQAVKGLQMKDVSAGKMRPPGWIVDDNGSRLERFYNHCDSLSLVDLDAVSPFAAKAFSDDEMARYSIMGQIRKRSYTGARIACKFLSRELSGGKDKRQAQVISTVAPDGLRPRCSVPGAEMEYYCSVSHDVRFAIAVAGRKKIGVDVEILSGRVLKSGRIYMNEDEKKLMESASVGQMQAALRVWTIKEAVSKAQNITLVDIWKKARVVKIGLSDSIFNFGGKEFTAYHETIDNHIFALVEMAEDQG